MPGLTAHTLGLAGLLAVSGAMIAAAPPATAQEVERGRTLYADYCAACHGDAGRGDGRRAALLTPPPADLTQLQGDGAFPVLQVVMRIDGRAPLVAHGGDMPVFGGAFTGDGPDVALPTASGQPVLMPQPIADLVVFLQEIQQ